MNHRMRIQNRRLRSNSGDPLEHNASIRRRKDARRVHEMFTAWLRSVARAMGVAARQMEAFSKSIATFHDTPPVEGAGEVGGAIRTPGDS